MKHKILLIEDEIHTSEILAEILEQQGYDVQVAYDSRTALDLINVYNPNLIIIDTSLSGINNLANAKDLTIHGDEKNIPVIIMTESNVFPPDDTLSGITDAHRILYKPCRPKTLLGNIEDALAYGHKAELQN